tara:strand:+ start:1506 stop:3803 length:2298 start_codon:yes stop_codon:yes gene_type:complete
MTNNNLDENSEYSLDELLFLIRKHFKLIFFTFSIVIFCTIYYTLLIKPQYKSSSTILISDMNNSMSMFELGFGNELNYIDNEIKILKSRSTSELVIEKLFNSEHKNNLYLFGTKLYQPTWYRELLSFGLMDRFQKKNIYNENLDLKTLNILAKNLLNQIEVKNDRDTDAITVSVISNNPDESSLLTNKIIEVYIERDLKWVTGEMSNLKAFLEEQLIKKENELKKIEDELELFQKEKKIFSLDENSAALIENVSLFETQYYNIITELEIAKEREKYLNKELNQDEKQLVKLITNSVDARMFALRDEITKLESTIISTLSKYGDEHPEVEKLRQKLEVLKNQLKYESQQLIQKGITVSDPILYRQSLVDSIISIKSKKAYLVSKSNSYFELVKEYNNKLSNLPSKIIEFSRLERIRTIHAETYSLMRRKLEEAAIGEASKSSKIRIIDYAIPNRKPLKPNKLINLIIGSFLGLFSGFLFALIVEYFDKTVKSIEQIERLGLSILSIIPAIASSNDSSSRKNKNRYINKDLGEKLKRRLITQEDPKSPVSEAYRSLRTSIMYSKTKDHNCQVILVSSSGPGEGKTTTIANLAITYANLGKKTLLIDSDLRKPVLHNVFKVDKSPGLTSFLSNQNFKISNIINKTDIDNLDFISSGVIPPNPSELLESEKMNDILQEFKKQYDIILFDSPPLIAVTDALVIMKEVDHFLLVVRAGVTEKGALERVIESIKNAQMNITGVVMNAIKKEHSYGAGYYYNYYQYYYGGDNN